ncbi:transposon ty3-I gag-pol polyprotein, partial [Tanacetum coccineum]
MYILIREQLDLWFDPSNNGVNKEARLINQLIVNTLQGTDIELLDLTHLSEFKADAHPAMWLGKKDDVSVWGQDCMHWLITAEDTILGQKCVLVVYTVDDSFSFELIEALYLLDVYNVKGPVPKGRLNKGVKEHIVAHDVNSPSEKKEAVRKSDRVITFGAFIQPIAEHTRLKELATTVERLVESNTQRDNREFFTYYETPGIQRLTIASVYFEGSVILWFQMLQKANQIPTWDALASAIEEHFGPSQYESPRAQLFKLTQTTSAAEYYHQFTIMANRVDGLSPDALLDCFLSGLKNHIRQDVIAQAPKSLIHA